MADRPEEVPTDPETSPGGPPPRDETRPAGGPGKAKPPTWVAMSGLGFEFVGAILLPGALGWWIDRQGRHHAVDHAGRRTARVRGRPAAADAVREPPAEVTTSERRDAIATAHDVEDDRTRCSIDAPHVQPTPSISRDPAPPDAAHAAARWRMLRRPSIGGVLGTGRVPRGRDGAGRPGRLVARLHRRHRRDVPRRRHVARAAGVSASAAAGRRSCRCSWSPAPPARAVAHRARRAGRRRRQVPADPDVRAADPLLPGPARRRDPPACRGGSRRGTDPTRDATHTT